MMFVCLFFDEDRTLSVLPREDKNLTYNKFEEGQKCTMKWLGRKTYSGTILKINENLEVLEKWASKANVAILKKAKGMETEELVKKLMVFSYPDHAKEPGKRQRVETSRAKESKEQAQDMSPKKKKANDGKEKLPLKSSTKQVSKEKMKKQVEATAALNSATEIIALASQFTPLSETWDLCQAAQETRNSFINTDPSDTYEVQSDREVTEHQLYNVPPRDYSYADEPVYTTLVPQMYPTKQEPSAKVIGILRGLLDPDFQEYLRNLLRRFDENKSQQDSCNNIINRTPNHSVHKEHQEWNTLCTPTASPKRLNYTGSPTCRRSPRLARQPVDQSTPRKILDLQPPSFQHQNKSSNISIPGDGSLESAKEGPAPKSQNKSFNITIPRDGSLESAKEGPASKSQMVKLMEKSPITVNRAGLKKAISLAKKSSSPGYALCRKLLPLLFTIEEMARSRGQGLLRPKDGDLRPVLDVEKTQILKDYISSWCKTNGFSVPSEAKINEGITETISYSRRLMKK